MQTKIVLTIDGDLTNKEEEDLRFLLSDALAEFIEKRTPPEVYVRRKYDFSSPATHAMKTDQVHRRVLLAMKLRTAALNFRVGRIQ